MSLSYYNREYQIMTKEDFIQLLEGWLQDRLNEGERKLLQEALADPAWEEVAAEMIQQHLEEKAFNFNPDLSQFYSRMESRITKPKVRRMNWLRYAATAAAVAAIVFAGKYFIDKPAQPATAIVQTINVPAPSKNRAMIMLGDGKPVYLDSAGNGELAVQNGIQLTKLADGKIAYTGSNNSSTITYNTLINPKGSKVAEMKLPDGSMIWLNAGSTARYAVGFANNKRSIELNGEAYLEVAHDAAHPFVVSKANTSITVLGTHFNVKAYDNDPSLKVTLLEGSVKVAKDNANQLLKPNQQAIVSSNKIQLIEKADTEEAVAWKNGYTSFFSTDLKTLLNEIERWYDINIEMKIDASKALHDFYVNVKRTAPLKDVLKVLDNSKVKYSYDEKEKKLTVLP